MLDKMFWEYEYNFASDDPQVFNCPVGTSTGPCAIAPTDRNILFENKLLGLPR